MLRVRLCLSFIKSKILFSCRCALHKLFLSGRLVLSVNFSLKLHSVRTEKSQVFTSQHRKHGLLTIYCNHDCFVLYLGWYTYWKPYREFATDMAGFAVNVNLILRHPEAAFPTRVRIGELEDVFLRQLVTRDELEPRAANCTQVGHPPFTSGQPVTMSTNHSCSFLVTRFWCGTLGRRR